MSSKGIGSITVTAYATDQDGITYISEPKTFYVDGYGDVNPL